MSPREAATATASEATPFVVENTLTTVSCSHGASSDPVAKAAPQINDLAAIPVDRNRGPDLLATGQVATEGFDDLSVPLVDVTTNQIARDLHSEPWFAPSRAWRD